MTKTFDPAKPVQTRDGRSARIICTDRKGKFPIVALIPNHFGEEVISRRTHDGRVSFVTCAHPGDLVNAPERTERFFAVYPTDDPALGVLSSEDGPAVIEISPYDWRLSAEDGRFGIKVAFEDGKAVSVEMATAA